MTMTTEGAPPTFAELRQRILDGGTVSEDEYARAKTLAELDELQAIAEQQAAARQAEAERTARIAEIGEKLTAAFDDEGDEADLEIIRTAVASIAQRADRRRQAFDAAFGALAREGVPISGQPVAGATRHPYGMGLGERIEIDGRTITYVAPGRNVSDAIVSGLADAGKGRGFLVPGVELGGKRKTRTETPEQAKQREQLMVDMRAKLAAEEAAK
jgi:hypothetical protein